jgi:predicted dehydrogenase
MAAEPQRSNRARDEVVRVGVVGLGYWGPNLVRNLIELEGAEVAHLCDARVGTLSHVARRYPGIPCSTDFESVLSDSSVDAVAISTPVASHHSLALAALEAGKHVFVEKPLAGSSEKARHLIDASARRKLVLMPGHTFLYSPPVTAIKELIADGALGTIYFISTSRVNLGLHQPDVSVVWDLGPHDFSILNYWLDELPQRISAFSRDCIVPGTPDVAFVGLGYPSGTVAHMELSWLAPSKLRRTAIVGSEKMVIYDDTSTESVRIFDSGASLPDPESFGEYRLTYRTGDILSPRIAAVEPLSLELAEFRSAILYGTPLRSSPQVGLDVVRTIEAVDRSLASGGLPVSLDGETLAGSFEQELAVRAKGFNGDGQPRTDQYGAATSAARLR